MDLSIWQSKVSVDSDGMHPYAAKWPQFKKAKTLQQNNEREKCRNVAVKVTNKMLVQPGSGERNLEFY